MSFEVKDAQSLLKVPLVLNWLICRLVETKSLGMLFGKPGASKSLLAMKLAYCIANGIDFHGLKTKQGAVIYLAGEGFAGLQRRFKALEVKYGLPVKDIYYSTEPINLMDAVELEKQLKIILKACPGPILIIIDTLHRNFGDGDENSAKDFGLVLSRLTKIINEIGCSILLVHHSGHGNSDRGRGSSSIAAGLDFSYMAKNENGAVTLSCNKAKEFETPYPLHFQIEGIDLPSGWVDSNGDIINAPVIVPANPTMASSNQQTNPLPKQQQIILDALSSAIGASGAAIQVKNADGSNSIEVTAVSRDVWRQEACKAMDIAAGSPRKPDTNNVAFRRAVESLEEDELISSDNDRAWINSLDSKEVTH